MKKTLAALAAVTAVMAMNACRTTPAGEVQAGSAAPSQSSTADPSTATPSSTLTEMGEITSDLDAFENLPDTTDMRIERR